MTKAITNAIIQPLKLPGFLFWLTIFCHDGLFKWNIRKSQKFQPQVKPETFQCCCCDLIWRRSTCVVGEVTAACVLQQCLLWPQRLFLKDSSLLSIESSQEPHNSASEAVLCPQSCSSAGALNHCNFNGCLQGIYLQAGLYYSHPCHLSCTNFLEFYPDKPKPNSSL